ncbi:MAG: flagellar biosynthetic protein FliR [Nitrosomonas sp.]|nr:flagellar biosynthetic protein FliR [Nitrosomonas sp.]MDP1951124.1 flagellar biosynthetic protein FliR [Nitrosomonas sp.]
MISITTAELNTLLAAFIWPLSRILALIASSPVLGNPSFPVRVKLGLSMLITILVAPTLHSLPQVEPSSGEGLLILMQQILIGTAIGFSMRIVFVAVETAGEIIGLQMGLGFATIIDPQSKGQVPLIGRFLGLIASLAFLAIDGHLIMIALITQSFTTLPIGTTGISAPTYSLLANWGKEIFLSGLQLSLPVLAALLITNLALGVLSRAAPQLNIFAVGFPLTLAVGWLVLALAIPYFAPVFERLLYDGFNMMMGISNLSSINFP